MKILNNQDDPQNTKIRKTEDGRFSVYDLIRVVGGKKGQCEVWKRLCKNYPDLNNQIEYELLGQGKSKKSTPVATIEVCELILDLLFLGHCQTPKNKDIILSLESIFWMFQPEKEFYVKGKSQVYRIDLFLKSANVAVECDEHGHRYYDKQKEGKRQSEIEDKLKCKFVRFDPYDACYDDAILFERVANAIGIVDFSRYMLMQSIAFVDEIKGESFSSDRYRGLYCKTTGQLRTEGNVSKGQTPLDAMSTYDLTLNSLANQMALQSENPSAIMGISVGLRNLHESQTGKKLVPTWEEKQLRPGQARKVLSDGQMCLPF